MVEAKKIILGLLIILICIVMFDFIKNDGDIKPDDANLSDSVGVDDSTYGLKYSLDFSGADKIIVIKTDYTQAERPSYKKEITEVEVSQIEALLRVLPKTGLKMINMGPVVVYKLVAYKDGVSFAYVEFYGDMLKSEDTSFYGKDQGAEADETAIFDLIKF
jgi:hypothetical protein